MVGSCRECYWAIEGRALGCEGGVFTKNRGGEASTMEVTMAVREG
jgi:hypothetical protein